MVLVLEQCYLQNVISDTLLKLGIIINIITMIYSIGVNGILLLAMFKSNTYKTKFYTIMTSITLSDFITGAVISPYFLYLICQHSKFKKIEPDHTNYLFQTLFFTVVAAAILSSAFMSIDRYWFLKNPEVYASSQTNNKHVLVILIIWLISFICSLLKHIMNSVLFLVLFSTILVLVSGSLMSGTFLTYWRHFRTEIDDIIIHKLPSENIKPVKKTSPASKLPNGDIESQSNTPSTSRAHNLNVIRMELRKPSDTPSMATLPGTTDDITDSSHELPKARSSVTQVETAKQTDKRESFWGRNLYERRIVITLGIFTILFWLHYLPFIACSLFLYVCQNCGCKSLIISQEIIIYITVLGSGVRSSVFISRLSQAKEAIHNLFDRRHNRKRNYTLERDNKYSS